MHWGAEDITGDVAGCGSMFTSEPSALRRSLLVRHVGTHGRAVGQGHPLLRPKQDQRQHQRHDDDDEPPIIADQIHAVLTNSIARCNDGEARPDRRAASRKDSPRARPPLLREAAATRWVTTSIARR